jgi:hypothetical protein
MQSEVLQIFTMIFMCYDILTALKLIYYSESLILPSEPSPIIYISYNFLVRYFLFFSNAPEPGL